MISSRSIFFIVLIVFIILLSLGSAVTYIPYDETTVFSQQFPYKESFSVKSNEYTTYPNNDSIDSYEKYNINKSPVDKNCKRIWGFDGLLCSPDSEDNSLDTFSKASSSIECQSMGLTNSTGFLCLNEEQKKLLGSRGGNALGVLQSNQ